MEPDNICIQFVESIEKRLNHDEYLSISFYTSVMIDGININVFLKKKNNLYKYVMESPFVNNDNDDINLSFLEKDNFKTLLDLLIDIKIVISSYHFLDHKLLSPDQFNFAKLQRSFFPLSKENECSVCYESTNEYTICRHPICFQCREKTIKKNNHLCPICREDNLTKFPEELKIF